MRPPARLTSRPRAATRFWLQEPRPATALTSPQPTTSLIFMCRMTGPGPNFGANGTWLTLYRASTIITGGTTTISTSATGAVRTLTILEVAGLDPSPVDVKNQAGNTFTGGSCNSAFTTTNANDLVLNFCIDNSGSTNWAAQSPWLGVITTTGAYSSGVESQNTGTVGTFTPSWNPSSVGGDYANITIAYKAGSPVRPTIQPTVSIITEMHNGPIAETSGARS